MEKKVASELKNTEYNPILSLLGSRDQLCVHEEVSNMKGAAKNHACQALVGARRCKYHRGTEGMDLGGAGRAGGGAAAAAAAVAAGTAGGASGRSDPRTVSFVFCFRSSVLLYLYS